MVVGRNIKNVVELVNKMKMNGVKFSGIFCGVKKNGKKDLAIAVFDEPVMVAGVFTKNLVQAPSVKITKKRIIKNDIKALIVVSGNACVCVKDDEKDAKKVTEELAKKLKVKSDSIAHAATGVIGVKLPIEKVIDGIPKALENLKDDFVDFAKAITTTDAFEKISEKTITIKNKKVNILGIAKGAGMIAPNLATMLVFIFTDAKIKKIAMKRALKECVEDSFNSISVDGDMSTNDMVLIFSTGKANNDEITESDHYEEFKKGLFDVCISLAKQIVKDGEGATKVITIKVDGAKTKKDAEKIARTIATSQLVKTAFFGEDPNWGRIMAAIGRSNVKIEPKKIKIFIQDKKVVENGVESSDFNEEYLKKLLKSSEVCINVELHMGKAKKLFYTSDLTLDYVKINSSYRT